MTLVSAEWRYPAGKLGSNKDGRHCTGAPLGASAASAQGGWVGDCAGWAMEPQRGGGGGDRKGVRVT